MAKDLQIGCYLTKAEANDLKSYAAEHQLSRPKLCILLVQRELRCRRLGELSERYTVTVRKKEGRRVTTRSSTSEIKDKFSRHVQELDLGSDDAAAIIFRAELEERWLSSALGWVGNRP